MLAVLLALGAAVSFGGSDYAAGGWPRAPGSAFPSSRSTGPGRAPTCGPWWPWAWLGCWQWPASPRWPTRSAPGCRRRTSPGPSPRTDQA